MNDRVSDCVSTISALVLTLLFSPSIALAGEKAESIKTDLSVQTMVLPELAQIITPSEEPASEPQPAPLDSAISTAAADLKGESDQLSRSHTPGDFLPVIQVAQSEPDVTPAEPAPAEAGVGNLAQQAQNPIANLISIPLQHNVNFNVGSFDQTQYVLNVQPVIPIELSDDLLLISRIVTPLILQPTVDVDTVETNGVVTPVLESGGSVFGLGDINPSFFFVPQTDSNITWGIGPVFSFPTATNDVLGTGRWSAGPTGVAVVRSGNWQYGVLANQLWSFAGDEDRPEVSQFLLQPFVSYSLPQGWTISSAPTITANWNAENEDKWTVPVGLTVSKLVVFGRQPVQFALGGFYNVVRPDAGADWTLRFQTTLLFPGG
ncbi:neuromedin U [filamentous cyanobacterium CCP1]|nr:neuromedin U [filamentous cyanobacterium CCP2]PSB67382.1 neuromedin U [filamentous cyanobacterium CCP1]